MATLDIAQAASTIGRPTETIERWILDGTVEAERDDRGWAVDVRSLLNAATADDAGVRPATFPGAGFAVVHDAFPSIELAFLLGMGLEWHRSVERIRDGWSNPYGGLLTFGHALAICPSGPTRKLERWIPQYVLP